ncbi:hypothetical protein SynA1560_01936 [Synechococcus sp. A15-60]|nr:hypothetical protein SynA1560_01936 [Synechococcus sp. A15-60]
MTIPVDSSLGRGLRSERCEEIREDLDKMVAVATESMH